MKLFPSHDHEGLKIGIYGTTSLSSPMGANRVVLFVRQNILKLGFNAVSNDVIEDITIEVNPDGTGDFLTIAEGLSASFYGATVSIKEGDYYEQGMLIPDGVKIIGIGTVNVIGELTESASTAEITNTSTFDAKYNFNIENVNVSCKNMRYPIHADFSNGNSVKNAINCRFVHKGNSEAFQYRVDNTIVLRS